LSLYLDKSFANLISQKLPLFKWNTPNVANFRCTYCGDSKSNKYRKRGYLYELKDGLNFKCQRCGKSCSFSNFLKDIDPNLHKDYIFEKFQDKQKFQPKAKEEPILDNTFNIDSLVSIKDLPKTHHARKYVENRKIPEKFWDRLFYSSNYKLWVNTYIIPDKFKNIPESDDRLVIPFYNKSGKAFAFQGRDLTDNPNVERYITIKAGKELLIYGLERIDITKEIYLLEGPIDSLCIKQALAAAGSSLKKLIKSELDIIFVFDNEPRSKQIIDLMEEIIKNNRKIFIWPKNVLQKDINDAIIEGVDIEKIIKKNIYHGLNAQLKFQEWKKV
jgi:hypothetical protein